MCLCVFVCVVINVFVCVVMCVVLWWICLCVVFGFVCCVWFCMLCLVLYVVFGFVCCVWFCMLCLVLYHSKVPPNTATSFHTRNLFVLCPVQRTAWCVWGFDRALCLRCHGFWCTRIQPRDMLVQSFWQPPPFFKKITKQQKKNPIQYAAHWLEAQDLFVPPLRFGAVWINKSGNVDARNVLKCELDCCVWWSKWTYLVTWRFPLSHCGVDNMHQDNKCSPQNKSTVGCTQERNEKTPRFSSCACECEWLSCLSLPKVANCPSRPPKWEESPHLLLFSTDTPSCIHSKTHKYAVQSSSPHAATIKAKFWPKTKNSDNNSVIFSILTFNKRDEPNELWSWHCAFTSKTKLPLVILSLENNEQSVDTY